MSAETAMSTTSISQNYSGKFKLSKLDMLQNRCLKTPPFSPMPNINIKFCFEVYYMCSNISCSHFHTGHDFILIKLKLRTLCFSGVPSTMRLKLDVGLNFLDGACLHSYEVRPALTPDEISSIFFEDVLNSYAKNGNNMGKLVNEKSLIIQCRMEFFNHINPPPAYYKELNSAVHLKNFASNFNSIHTFGELSDIAVVIGEKSLPAHKAVMAAHSPVFKNMLTHDFKESMTNTITITDFTAETFECFLKYMYSGEVEDESWPTVKELYALADKYDISSLKQLLCEIITSQISLEKICDILNLAFDYDDEIVKKEAVGFASVHFRELISTKEWKELIVKHPLAGYETAISFIL